MSSVVPRRRPRYRDRLFPKNFEYMYYEGVDQAKEENPLFGDLVEAIELAVDLDRAADDNPIRRSAVPNFTPGTSAHRGLQRRAAHFRRRRGDDEGSRRTSTSARSSGVYSERSDLSSHSSRGVLSNPFGATDGGDGARSPHSRDPSPSRRRPSSSLAQNARSSSPSLNTRRRMSRANSMRALATARRPPSPPLMPTILSGHPIDAGVAEAKAGDDDNV